MTPRFLPGNRIELLHNGEDFFPALLEAIRGAEREIHLETYIFADDPTGRTVAAALAAAARRGIKVRVLVDGFGAREFTATVGRELPGAGVEVQIYRPEVARLRFRRHRLRRLHRKLAVIDGRIGFVGGINIIDDMDTPGQMPPRIDYAVRIEGPLLPAIHDTVRRLWRLIRWANFRRRPPDPGASAINNRPAGDLEAAFVVRDNLRHRRDIEDAYLAAIEAANREIVLANAYFLPGIRFRHALTDAAQRGVRVTLLLQGRVEYALLHYATQAFYNNLIAAGVRIVEYRRSFLHAKVGVVDGHWATVGSSNIDPFSLMLAREANIVVRDIGFAEQLRTSLEETIRRGGVEIDRETLKRRPLLLRAVSWLAYGIVRLAIGVAGYGMGKEYKA